AVNSLPEQMRVFPTMIRWVGFKSTTIEINHAARAEGASSYNIWKRLELAADICLAYSDKPLRLVVWSGFVISLAGFALSIYTIILALKGEIAVMGYASLIVSIWVFSGIIISVVGVVGLYVGKTFEGVKRRPAFIVDLDGSNMQPKHLNE
ncbi:MAG: glycosyltransferase, partial [Verrucomicrobiota bacterium]